MEKENFWTIIEVFFVNIGCTVSLNQLINYFIFKIQPRKNVTNVTNISQHSEEGIIVDFVDRYFVGNAVVDKFPVLN
jgi:hypothetical protein